MIRLPLHLETTENRPVKLRVLFQGCSKVLTIVLRRLRSEVVSEFEGLLVECGHATDATDHSLPAARCKVSAREALIRRGMASWHLKCNVRCLKIKPVSPGTAISAHGIRSGGCPIRKIGKTDIYNPYSCAPIVMVNNFHSGRGISSGRFETAKLHRGRCPWRRRIYLK
jgi:hypothetical protein